MTPDLSSFGPFLPWAALIFVLMILAAVVQRIPVLRWIVSLAVWGCIAWLLAPALSQYVRASPSFDGLVRWLGLDEQQVVGDEVRIRVGRDGHFWVEARLNGVKRRMLVDSGATVTALSPETATAAGLKPQATAIPVLMQTANGTVAAQMATIGEVRLGSIEAKQLSAVVSSGLSGVDILGMNFLSRLKEWRVEGGRTLILVPHHPIHRLEAPAG